jgi:hypothetical protein
MTNSQLDAGRGTGGRRSATIDPPMGDGLVAADDAVRCPECGVPVEPNWDWCENCSFDPVHLKPPDWEPADRQSDGSHAAGVAPATGATVPSTPPPPAPPSPRPTPPPGATQPATPVPRPRGDRAAVAPRPVPARPAPKVEELLRPASVRPDVRPETPAAVAAPTAATATATATTVAPRASRRVGARRWLLILVAILAVGALASGLAIFGSRGPSTAAQERRLNSRLLSASDLPQGWSVVPPTTDLPPTVLNCLAGGQGSNGSVPVAAVGFRSPVGIPNLVEVLEGYSRAGALRRFNQLTSQVFHGCPTTTKPSTSSGLGQTQILVMPQVGDQSAAVTVTTAGATTSTVVISRTNGTIVYLVYETHGPPDTSLLQLVSIRATAKASAR